MNWEPAALNTIFNAAVTLIVRNYRYFKELLLELKLLSINDTFALKKMRLIFILVLSHYFETKDDSKLVNDFFPSIELLDFKQLSVEMKKLFKG